MSAKLGTANAPAAEGNRPDGQVDAKSLQDRLVAQSGDVEALQTLGALADPALFTGAVDIDGWSGEAPKPKGAKTPFSTGKAAAILTRGAYSQ